MFKLGIAIPTRKRFDSLLRAIDVLLNKINKGYLDEVTVTVSLNSYSKHECDELKSRYSDVNFVIPDRALSHDENMLYAVSNSPSEYIWILADDDDYTEIDLSLVLNSLIKKPEYVFVNYNVRSGDNIRASRFNKKWGLKTKYCLNLAYSFIGSNIIKKSTFESTDKKMYMNSNFLHMGIIGKILDSVEDVSAIDEIQVTQIGLQYNESRGEHGSDFYLSAWKESMNIALERKSKLLILNNFWMIGDSICWEVANLFYRKQYSIGKNLLFYYIKKTPVLFKPFMVFRLYRLILLMIVLYKK